MRFKLSEGIIYLALAFLLAACISALMQDRQIIGIAYTWIAIALFACAITVDSIWNR